MTARILLEMPDELLSQVESHRGDVPRNVWLRRAIEQRIARETDPETIPVPHREPPPKEQPVSRPTVRQYDHPFKSRGGNRRHICFTCGEAHG